MNLRELIKGHLNNVRIMQLATSIADQPWICTLHFYADSNLDFYWISTPERRHSKEIDQNQKCSITVVVHEDTKKEKYIIGITAEGIAKKIGSEEARKIGSEYIDKLGRDPKLLQDILERKNPHVFYRFQPSKIILFDTKNFPKDPKQELKI